jgi:multisubunit Na+/H+ antiporter MnhC subunit
VQGVVRDNLIVDAQGLTLANWSLTWTVVDPIVVALPLSILTAVVVALATKPMDKAHVAYVFGGAKPNA